MSEHILALENVSKRFGSVLALQNITMRLKEGEVHCLLGDNGAGKSTLIKILSGLNTPTGGQLLVDDAPTTFSNPRDALDAGIATVYQDLALVPQLSVWRNFFLGQELTGRFGGLQEKKMRAIAREQLAQMGVELPDIDVELEALSGGQRQVVAIARAIYFGARYIVLDEPTAALGVKQSGMVLRFIAAAKQRGMGVVFITHNPQHAYLVGDRFVVLNLGEVALNADKADVSVEELTKWMAGGAEMETLKAELAS